jgi:ABC-type sugar transport system substrate-binding protein
MQSASAILPAAILSCVLLQGCGGTAADSGPAGGPAGAPAGAGGYRVVHTGEGQWLEANGRREMESALERCPRIDLVYAHNDPMAHGALLAARQQRRDGIRFVGVDALPHEGRKYVVDGLLDATIEYPTCAAEAIDLALLACNGVQFPSQLRELVVGTRVWTRANHAGGKAISSPGEIMLTNLRHQHAAILTTEPKTDQIFRIGMAQCNDAEPWREAMREQMKAWARRYPQVEFSYRDAANDTEKQRGIVRDFVDQGYNAIIVSPKESGSLASACKDALTKQIAVVVLDRKLGTDDFTVFVGGDNLAIGRAAGETIKELLPNGGAIVELQGLMTSSPAQERHRGFVEALGLPK